jgi:hypothetical protein
VGTIVFICAALSHAQRAGEFALTKEDCRASKPCQAMPRRSCTLKEACQELAQAALSAGKAWGDKK